MTINAPSIKELSSLQSNLGIKNNKLLLFSFSLMSGKATVVKSIQEECNLTEEEIISFVKILEENDFISKKEIDIIKKLEKTKIIDIKNYEVEVSDIISHLNNITSSRRKVTSTRIKLVEQWLRRGYTLEQFVMVNLFFYNRWGNNPEMTDYVRPETLYNTKFPERVEEAEIAFKMIIKHKEAIHDICILYHKIYTMCIDSSIEDNGKCSFLPFLTQKRIAFWLNRGFSVESINLTIEITIKSWSKKEDLIPLINLEKILDNKFEDRYKISLKNNNSLIPQKAGVSVIEDWINE